MKTKKGSRTRLRFDKITGSFYKEVTNKDYFTLIELIINSKNGISKNKLAESIFGKSDDDEVSLYRRIRVSVMLSYLRSNFQIWFVTERRWMKEIGKNTSFVRLATTIKDLNNVKDKLKKHIKDLMRQKEFVSYDIKNFDMYKLRLEKLKEGTLMAQTVKKGSKK